MRIARLSGVAPAGCRGAVVAIGNFDGVHRGHRVLISRAQQIAATLGRSAGVLTFEPHPREYFAARAPAFSNPFFLNSPLSFFAFFVSNPLHNLSHLHRLWLSKRAKLASLDRWLFWA